MAFEALRNALSSAFQSELQTKEKLRLANAAEQSPTAVLNRKLLNLKINNAKDVRSQNAITLKKLKDAMKEKEKVDKVLPSIISKYQNIRNEFPNQSLTQNQEAFIANKFAKSLDKNEFMVLETSQDPRLDIPKQLVNFATTPEKPGVEIAKIQTEQRRRDNIAKMNRLVKKLNGQIDLAQKKGNVKKQILSTSTQLSILADTIKKQTLTANETLQLITNYQPRLNEIKKMLGERSFNFDRKGATELINEINDLQQNKDNLPPDELIQKFQDIILRSNFIFERNKRMIKKGISDLGIDNEGKTNSNVKKKDNNIPLEVGKLGLPFKIGNNEIRFGKNAVVVNGKVLKVPIKGGKVALVDPNKFRKTFINKDPALLENFLRKIGFK